MPITADDILSSDGQHPQRAAKATAEHRANAVVTAQRVNGLLHELGYKDGDERPRINDGYRDESVTYGAKRSAHKEGKALDLDDDSGSLDKRITRPLLVKYKLRREDSDYTHGWSHLDTREPYGVFKP